MKKFSLFLALLSISLVFFSCSSDDDDDNNGDFNSKIVGKWMATQGKSWSEIDGKVVSGSENSWVNGEDVDFFEFEKDGTGIEGNGPNLNSVSVFDIKWQQKDNQIIVVDPYGGQRDTYNIEKITDKELVLLSKDEDEDEVYCLLNTYKRVDSTPPATE